MNRLLGPSAIAPILLVTGCGGKLSADEEAEDGGRIAADGGAGTGQVVATLPAAPSGCTADGNIACPPGTLGVACPDGVDATESGAACSVAQPQGDGVDAYCCTAFTANGCTPDPDAADCDAFRYGFTCPAGVDPTTQNPMLACDTPAAGASDAGAYCCIPWPNGTSPCAPVANRPAVCPFDGSYAFACVGNANPGAELGSFLCTDAGIPDPDGTRLDYCCR